MSKYKILEHKSYNSIGRCDKTYWTVEKHTGLFGKKRFYKNGYSTSGLLNQVEFTFLDDAEQFIERLLKGKLTNKTVVKTVKVI